MYSKGELIVSLPPCPDMDPEDGQCEESCMDGHAHAVIDSCGDYDKPIFHPVAFLPHSCDKWVIGGPEQVRQLIADLTEALRKWEEAYSTSHIVTLSDEELEEAVRRWLKKRRPDILHLIAGHEFRNNDSLTWQFWFEKDNEEEA